jgi:hypothetical protein
MEQEGRGLRQRSTATSEVSLAFIVNPKRNNSAPELPETA